MHIDDLQNICKKLPGVTEDIKWENHLCFCVGQKMFLIVGLDQVPTTASFKVKPEDFDELSVRKGFAPAQYLARYNWVWTSDIRYLNPGEWENYIHQSYELVKNKLSKKIRTQLGLT